MSEPEVLIAMASTFASGNDVIETRGSIAILAHQVGIDRVMADMADPSVPLIDLEPLGLPDAQGRLGLSIANPSPAERAMI